MSKYANSGRSRWARTASFGRLLLTLVAFLAACTPTPAGDDGPYGGDATEPAATEAPGGGGQAEVAMQGTAFEPEEITVPPVTTVTWTNEDSFEHTVTSGERGSPTDMFDETVAGGGSFSFTFDEPGTYEYFCSIHRGMSGVVVVEE